MKAGRYSGLAACAVLLLTAVLMLTCFARSETRFAPVTDLPSAQTAAGYGHTKGEDQVNVNTASAGELETLPGIGPTKAADIVTFREEHGPFRYPEELIRVKGIGEGILGDILDLITTGGD